LRAVQQEFAENPNEISGFDPELVLRDVPGKSVQRGRQSQRFRGSLGFPAIQDSTCDEIVRMTLPPSFLLLFSAGDLAIRVSTSSLAEAYARIGAEPTSANTTRFLWDIWHGDQ